ncbi:MAG: hypothetical protein DU429_06605 [Candidatus Tokpelaia sp.]|nr:MAG: hypothetical protein DU430_04405 [Candidatus Tokpelaia sp.]KAA6206227.1 MAG: hypothetical protein DU429_06605 [Candidatus Tokpelaia sp.]
MPATACSVQNKAGAFIFYFGETEKESTAELDGVEALCRADILLMMNKISKSPIRDRGGKKPRIGQSSVTMNLAIWQ